MTEAKEACVHYWIIETPNGSLSKGVCKLCGSEREYYNSLEYMWEVQKKEEGSNAVATPQYRVYDKPLPTHIHRERGDKQDKGSI